MYIPKLIYRPKWHKDEENLQERDLVYFQKDPDNPLGSKWVMGLVDQVIRSRDGKVRRVIIKYQNHGEELPRFTDRSVRKLVKIYDIDEFVLQDDLSEVLKRINVPCEGIVGDQATSSFTIGTHARSSSVGTHARSPFVGTHATNSLGSLSPEDPSTPLFPRISEENPNLCLSLVDYALSEWSRMSMVDELPSSLREDFTLEDQFAPEDPFPPEDSFSPEDLYEDMSKLLQSTRLVLE